MAEEYDIQSGRNAEELDESVRIHGLTRRLLHLPRETILNSLNRFSSAFSSFTLKGTDFVFHEGIIQFPHHGMAQVNDEIIIVADIEKRQLLRVNETVLTKIEHNRIIDLNNEGDRWEGDAIGGNPFGWGVLYDKDNNETYEGFRIGKTSVCYGRSFFPDIHATDYEGELLDGKRWGSGTQYARSGAVLTSGDWVDNEESQRMVTVPKGSDTLQLHNHIQDLTISDACCNDKAWQSLDLSFLPLLRGLSIGKGCFTQTEVVKLVGMKELESVVIEEKSFSKSMYVGNPNRRFFVKQCPKLRELRIKGYLSFSDYTVCEIENVDALEVIEVGDTEDRCYSFYHASLQLKGGPGFVR